MGTVQPGRQALLQGLTLGTALLISLAMGCNPSPSKNDVSESAHTATWKPDSGTEPETPREPTTTPSDKSAAKKANPSADPPANDQTIATKTTPGNIDREARFREYKQGAYVAFKASRLMEAERLLRAALAIHRDDPDLNRAMAMLLNSEGRRWEAAEFGFRLLKIRRYSVQDLALLANTDELYDNAPLLKKALRVEPDSRIPLLGLARLDLLNKRRSEARTKLEQVLAYHPELSEAHAQYGTILLDNGDSDAFLKWRRSIPESALVHPEIWFVFGRWAESHGQPRSAARCYWEALRRDPNHRRAYFELATVLKQLGRDDDAEPLLRRSELLTELHEAVHPIMLKGPDVVHMQRVVTLLESMGRIWEAAAWCVATAHFMKSQGHNADKWIAKRDELKSRLDAERTPRVLAGFRLDRHLVLSDYPLPDWSKRRQPTRAGTLPSDTVPIRWDDLAERAGLKFTYYDSAQDRADGIQIMDSTGGGVAVLDYDQDGWPDIYLTQCRPWPPDGPPTQHRDRLFRNLGNGTFQDVTDRVGIDERGFSQGCTSGDFNNDGWPDLYVANIGTNRLFVNNGDGTFSPVPLPDDPEPLIWTTSVALVDFNGDGLPDIYDVNYLGGNVYSLRCGTPQRRKSCGPSAFPGRQDRLFLNQGDGRWREATEESGLNEHVGKGLGIVAVDLNRDGRLEAFIANDGEANFLLVADPSESAGLRWKDEALLRGLAFDRDGIGQACMGVAVDDADGDGRLDLFVTNYYDDHNTLYLQEHDSLFVDKTREASLFDASLQLLGFGTQFVDADLDGWPDLLLTNGHVDDVRYDNEPFKMPPQFFRNLGKGVFKEVPRATSGSYFDRTYLGRGMAVIDWDRNGVDDVVVSHIGSPAALVTNVSDPPGHSLVLRLRGRRGTRDAYGTTVELHYGDRVRVRQLVGGSGYQACNQRQLVIGTGQATEVEKLVVFWPSGSRSTFSKVACGREWLVIEGEQRPIEVVKE